MNAILRTLTAGLLGLSLASAGCGGSKLPTAKLSIAGHALTVEVADDEGERAQGLMHRDSLGANRGMLFAYDDDAIRRFWMKDTRIPLSIAFIDRKGTILRIADMAPFDTTSTSSLYPVRYALEVNKGWFEEKGIGKGEVVEGLP